jgi:hypothetical protein
MPAKHGVTHFFNTAKNIRCRRLWDILESSERPVGLFAWPVTWPPRPINGFMVPSLFARDHSTFPPELRFVKDLEGGMDKGWSERIGLVATAMRHGLRVATAAKMARYALTGRRAAQAGDSAHSDLDRFAGLRFLKLDVQLDIFEYLTRAYRPYLSTFYLNQIDAFSHRFWRYYEPQVFDDVTEADVVRYGDMVPRVYETADRAVGRLVKLADEDTVIAVISDHGFEATDTGAHSRQFVGRVIGSKLLQALNLVDQATYVNHRAWVIVKLGAKANERRKEILTRLSTFRVPEFNRAEAPLRPLFKVTDDPTGEIAILIHLDTERLLNSADMSALHVEYARASDAGNGDGTTDQNSSGSALDPALEPVRVPLLDLVQAEYDTRMSGVHHPDGITILSGPGVRAGVRIEQASVLDVSPTLLALMGTPVGRDMDGSVLTEAIRPEFLAKTPVSYVETHDAGFEYSEDQEQDAVPEELMSRLRALGYVD